MRGLTRLVFAAILLFAPAGAVAARSGPLHFAAGVEFLSVLAKRGATLYGGYQVIPIWAVDLWSPDLQIIGTALYYKRFLTGDWLQWRSRLNPGATGDKPLYPTAAPAPEPRESTMEWDNFLHFRWPERGEIGLSWSQDLVAHGGGHFELEVRAVLGSFWRWKARGDRARIQPALFATLGGGTAGHNRYLYGEGAAGGLNSYSYGLLVAAPAAIDRFFPVVKISRYGVAGGANRGASLVAARPDGFQVIALGALKLF